MRLLKKLTALALVALLVLSIVPVYGEAVLEGPHGLKYAETQELRLVYDAEATSLNSFYASGSANNWQAISNCVEGLVTVDVYGNKIPALAESWEISEDGTVYTFHIRKGLQWVDVNGNEKGELTAKDFVAVAKIICTPEVASGSVMYFEGIIKGAKEFYAGETTDFDTVGFKALDDYTIEITLEGALPYFLSYCGSYMPAYAPYLEEMGDQYGLSNDQMYYIGAYIMTTFEPEYRRVYEKNPNYYNADEVYIERVVMTYNKEAATLAPELFLRGEIDEIKSLDVNVLDEWKKNDETKDIVIPGLPDLTYMYYYGFNYDPQFDAEYEPDNWRLAINNENFRQSLYWAINRLNAVMTQDPYNPQLQMTNSITPIGWCNVDGLDFTQIGPMKEITARANNQFDEQKALEYKEKAVEELTAAGVTFPIKMLMPYNPVLKSWEYEVQVVKQQITNLLGEDYIECILQAGPETGFLAEVRRTGKYAFMKLNNGSNIDDPDAWTNAFYKERNWNFMHLAQGADIEALVQEYYTMVDAAKADMAKSMSRYEKFAEAEAFLLNHAMVIPFCTDTDGYFVAKYNPFERPRNSDRLFRNMRVLAEPLTEDQFLALYADWVAGREASLTK